MITQFVKWILLGIMSYWLCGCTVRSEYMTPVPIPTVTPAPTATITQLPTYTPTATLIPTATLYPTNIPRPTATPYPTNTPRPTIPPSPTPHVTGIFRNLYYRSYMNQLGKPQSGWEDAHGVGIEVVFEQPMERGHMFGNYDEHKVYVTFGSQRGAWKGTGNWIAYNDSSSVGNGTLACDQRVSYQPTDWFGTIWCKPGVGERLGGYVREVQDWESMTDNAGIYRIQKFERGFIFRDSDGWTHGLAYVFFNNGTFQRVDCPDCRCRGEGCPSP